MAHSLVGKQTTNDMTLLDVLPMPIGINKVDGTMHILFPKNQPLPDYKDANADYVQRQSAVDHAPDLSRGF